MVQSREEGEGKKWTVWENQTYSSHTKVCRERHCLLIHQTSGNKSSHHSLGPWFSTSNSCFEVKSESSYSTMLFQDALLLSASGKHCAIWIKLCTASLLIKIRESYVSIWQCQDYNLRTAFPHTVFPHFSIFYPKLFFLPSLNQLLTILLSGINFSLLLTLQIISYSKL